VNQKQGQQKHTMITKNGLLRPNRNSSLIMSSKSKTKPIKTDSEPNIDFNNIPTIQGTYRATKINITAENATKGISEPIIDNKGLATTRRTPLQKHTTTSEKVLNRVESSPTDEPSTLFTKSTTAMTNKDKLNEKQENEMKTTPSGTTTVRNDLNIFKDFLNPDFENNSPWKPIVPGYVNTEFKLLPNDDVRQTSYTESTTRTAISRTSDFHDNVKMPNDETSTTSTVPKLPLGSVNFHDVSEINTFDIDNTDFPRDRIDPGLTKSNNHEKLDIEVAGQLPSEMYNVKLKASSYDGNERITSLSLSNSESSMTRRVPENISIQNNAFQEKHKNSNATQKVEAKFDNSASTMESKREKIMNDSLTSGVGVAEPILDTEIELEAKNRYRGSSILTTDEDMLRNRKVNINQKQPIYTSYNTPNLNGGSLGSSLIENPATTKPFRHTIPVDKITSVVNYNINVPFDNLDAPPLSDDTSTDEKLFQDKVLTPLPPKRIVEVETSIVEHDDTMTQLQSGQITSTEPNIIKDDNKSYFSTTESYSEPKLIAKDSSGKRGISRNSTFVEIDTVKHTPGESEENWESHHADEVTVNNDELQKKKIYNETLKAYVVENLVTLAPIKSNTGIGRPVRPKPKIDFPDTTLLEQLFGVRDYMHDRDTNTESTSEATSSHKIRNSTKSDEKNSNYKSTIVEQIVEVVTSISTRVSSNIKNDPVILKFIVTNSTNPVVHSEKSSNDEADKSSTVNTTETTLSLIQKRPLLSAANLRTMQTSDRKMSLEENRILLEKLKKLAQIKMNDDLVQITRNNLNLSEILQSQDHALSLDIEELKKIADVVTGNETLKNASSEFTLSRDGVEIFTKILNKEENETHTHTRHIHTVPTIQKLSKTNIGEWKSISSQSLGSFCSFFTIILNYIKN